MVRIHAEPNGTTYGFVFDQQTDWTISYSLLASCGELATLALTGSPLPIAAIGAAGLLLIAGLSLVAVHLVRRRHEIG